MKKYFPLGIILAIATALRWYHNLDIPLWHDEAFSAFLIRYDWSEMLWRIRYDSHPPMYFIFLKTWREVWGDSLLSLRGFSVLFGVLTVWAGWLFAKQAFKEETVAIRGAALLATNLFLLRFATEARMYAMGMFFSLLAAYFLVRALEHSGLSGRQGRGLGAPADRTASVLPYAGFAVSTAIAVLTHYYLSFTAGAFCLYGLLSLYADHRWAWRRYLPFLVAWLMVAGAFMVWLNVFLFQLGHVSANFWPPPLTAWSYPSILWDLLLGTGRAAEGVAAKSGIVAITVFTLYFYAALLRKNDSRHRWLIVLASAAPFAGSLLFNLLNAVNGNATSIIHNRYFQFAGIFYLIALAFWISGLHSKTLSRMLFYGYLVFNVSAFAWYWHEVDIVAKPGMAAAASYLNGAVSAGDKLYVDDSFLFFSFKYYNRSPARPMLLTYGETEAAAIPSYMGAPILSNEEMLPNVDRAVAPGDTVWLVGKGTESAPVMPGNWILVSEKRFVQMRPEGTSSRDDEYIVVKKFAIK